MKILKVFTPINSPPVTVGLPIGGGRVQALGLAGGGDSVAPTVVITCAQTSPSAVTPLNFTFTLSEPSTDFAIGDITVGGVGGTKSNFAGSSALYTCDIAPTANGTMTVDVAAGTFHDTAGNANEAATQFSITRLVYILQDEYTTNLAAGSVHDTNAEPGPGVRHVVDTGSLVPIASGKITPVGKSTYNDPRYGYSTPLTRAAGLAFLFSYNQPTTAVGFIDYVGLVPGLTTAINAAHGFILDSQALGVKATEAGIDWPLAAVLPIGDYEFAIILRANGAFYVRRDTNQLLWVSNAGNTATLYALGTKYYAQPSSFYYSRVLQLAAPWTTEFGMATASTASPATGATIATDANALIELTWTPVAAEVLEFQFRRVDDDNCWILRCDQAANTIKLYKKEAGTETELDAGKTMTWGTTAKRIVIRVTNAEIKTWVANVAKHNYASATFNQTATGAKISGFTVASNFVSWPGGVSLPSPF